MITKIIVVSVFAAGAMATVLNNGSPEVQPAALVLNVDGGKPPSELIDRFDRAIQQRFLEMPNFGIRRMAPTEPEPLESVHIRSFSPRNDDESAIIRDLVAQDWKVALYLYGRRADPKMKDDKPGEKFEIRYKVNEPVAVNPTVARDLPKSKSLIEHAKQAFIDFQTPASGRYDNYEFSDDDWTYVARPVRAVNQNCLTCHTDHVITERLGDGQFKFRKRRIGDANGVLIYAFTKIDKIKNQ